MQDQPARNYVEIGNEPEFFVTETRLETAPGGNVRLLAYCQHGTELRLLYTSIIPAPLLAQMAQAALTAAVESHNLMMMATGIH